MGCLDYDSSAGLNTKEPFESYIKAHPEPLKPGDMYDLSDWKYIAPFGLHCVKNIRQVFVVGD